jgi:hypothetical protein
LLLLLLLLLEEMIDNDDKDLCNVIEQYAVVSLDAIKRINCLLLGVYTLEEIEVLVTIIPVAVVIENIMIDVFERESLLGGTLGETHSI